MFDVLLARIKQKYRTIPYPKKIPIMPDRLRGRPWVEQTRCASGCTKCVDICPVRAITKADHSGVTFDLGRCLFCPDCSDACPQKAIMFNQDYRLATSRRDHLIYDPRTEYQLAKELKKETLRVFRRSLKLRQVSAAGCNACEADLNVLSTVVFDLARFGIQFVASPRHADGVVITGPVSKNMKLGLEKTYAAIAAPKLVICVGACAISGGPFIDHAEASNGATDLLPVDLFIPGCPPHPMTILDGFLRMLKRL